MLTTPRHGRRTIEAISTDTLSNSIDNLYGQATALLSERELIPAAGLDKHNKYVQRLLNAAADQRLITVADLIGRSTAVIAIACDVEPSALTKFSKPKITNRIHTARNILTALLTAGAAAQGDDPTSAAALIQPVGHRRGGKERPLRDDEIVLARILAEYTYERGGRRAIAALQYTLTEAGAWPSETVLVTGSDLDNIDAPTTLAVKGVNQRAAARHITLDPWSANHIGREARTVATRYPGAIHTDRLAFTGLSGNRSPQASSAVNTGVGRFLEDAGIVDLSVAASSPSKWRVLQVMEKEGVLAAMHASGHTRTITFRTWLGLSDKAVEGLPARIRRPGA